MTWQIMGTDHLGVPSQGTARCICATSDKGRDGCPFHQVPVRVLGGERPTVANPRIGLDDDGTLDDFYATGIQSVHFEALDDAAWYANIRLSDGRFWQLNFGAKNPRARGYAREERVR